MAMGGDDLDPMECPGILRRRGIRIFQETEWVTHSLR